MRFFLIFFFLGSSFSLLGQTLTYTVEEKGLELNEAQVVSLRNTVRYKLNDCLAQVDSAYAKASISPVVTSVQPAPYLGTSGYLLSLEAHVSFKDFTGLDIPAVVRLTSKGIGRSNEEALNSAISKLVVNEADCKSSLGVVSIKATAGDSLAGIKSACDEELAEARDLATIRKFESALRILHLSTGLIPSSCQSEFEEIQQIVEKGIIDRCPAYVSQFRLAFESGDSLMLARSLSRQSLLTEYCGDNLVEFHQAIFITQSENEQWNRKMQEVQLESNSRGSSMDQVFSLIRSFVGG